jgi:hypothetical protein
VKVTMMKVSDLLKLRNPRNPQSRVTMGALQPLKKLMQRYGFDLAYPIILGCDGIIGDGHRRLLVAYYLGITHVPVITHPRKTADQLFSDNQANKPVQPRQWMESYVSHLAVVMIPKNTWRKISWLKAAGGMQLLKDILSRGQGPGLYDQAKRACDLTRCLPNVVVPWVSAQRNSHRVRQYLDAWGRAAVRNKFQRCLKGGTLLPKLR